MAASAGRHPISAQCRVPGVPRSTCHHMPAGPPGAANAPAGPRRRCVRLPADLYDRGVVGCSCGRREGASLVRAASSNVEFPPTATEMFRSDRGAELCNAGIGALPTALGIERSVPRSGDPHDDAVVESTSRILKRELVAGGRFGSEEEPRAALLDWANRCDNFRIHSTLGYMSPVEFREAGLILS